MAKYTPQTRDELIGLVENLNINLGDIDTSAITDMSFLFGHQGRYTDEWDDEAGDYKVKDSATKRTDFSGIETWDTSNVELMNHTFYMVEHFNHDISGWNVSKVTNMEFMFWGAKSFNQPLNSWNVSSVTTMRFMFENAKAFNQPLDKWDTSKVEAMSDMFAGAENFNQLLNSWNVSKVQSTLDKGFNVTLRESGQTSTG